MPYEVVERQARELAEGNRQADPSITTIYWFPDEDEVRLVEASPEIPASDGKVYPFYFRASEKHHLPLPSGIALIRPEEARHATLPAGWLPWDCAVVLFDRPTSRSATENDRSTL